MALVSSGAGPQPDCWIDRAAYNGCSTLVVRDTGMKLYSKKGDGGQTRLGSGETVTKDDIRVAACGEVDELNAAVGLSAAACEDATLTVRLRRVQDGLLV